MTKGGSESSRRVFEKHRSGLGHRSVERELKLKMKVGQLIWGPAFGEFVLNHCGEMDGNCRARDAVVVLVVTEGLSAVDEESRQVGWRAKKAMPL